MVGEKKKKRSGMMTSKGMALGYLKSVKSPMKTKNVPHAARA